MNKLIIEAKSENITAVIDFIDSRIMNCDLRIKNQIKIAVDEIFSNIASYAYCKSQGKNLTEGKLAVSVSTDNNDVLTIEFEDNGIKYNPLSAKNPDISSSGEEREIGGLGIFIVKNIMDSVEYNRRSNKNILTIKKKLG